MKATMQRMAGIGMAAALLWLGAAQVQALDFTWQGGGVGDRDGVFQEWENWIQPVPPNQWIPEEGDRPMFGHADTYTVTFTAGATNQGSLISAGTVTFDLGGHLWRTGDSDPADQTRQRFDVRSATSGNMATSIVQNGYFKQTFQLRAGPSANNHGMIIFRGGNTGMDTPSFFLGYQSGTAIGVFEQGATGSVGNVRFGWEGAESHLILRDEDTRLQVTSTLDMNYGYGARSLTVTDGAELIAPSITAREHDITISNGARVEIGTLFSLSSGGDAGTLSTLTVDDAEVVMGGNFTAGSAGGRLTEVAITGGSAVDVGGSLTVASGTGRTEMTLDDGSTMLVRSTGFTVAGGTSNTGILHIAGGSILTVTNVGQINLATENTGAVGRIIVSGNQSLLESTFTGGAGANMNIGGNWYPPGEPLHGKGGDALLAVRDGGTVRLTRDPRVHESGTIEIDNGTLDIRRMIFHAPDGEDAQLAGTFRVILHSSQANASQAMVIGSAMNMELNGARFDLQLAPGFSAPMNSTFYLIKSAAGYVGGFTVWDDNASDWIDLNHGDYITAGLYEFQVDISGGDYKLLTTVIPEPGVLALLALGLAGLILRRRRG